MKSLASIFAFILVVYHVDALVKKGGMLLMIRQELDVRPCPPDIDECSENIDTCANDEVCVNTPGSYSCICADGYQKVEGICEDIDECSENIDTCANDEVCLNTAGSYSCICADGYQKVEGICEDINECNENNALCGGNETCVNMPGNFTCICQQGFVEVEGICEDINECNENIALCGGNETCVNTPGNFTCICQQGFVEVEGICEECVSPFLYLEGLGCLSLLVERLSWEDAQTKCQLEGKQLLEGIQHEHLEPLSQHFYDILPDKRSYLAWIGFKNAQWITSEEAITDDLWRSGEPDGGSEICGQISLRFSKLGLADRACGFKTFGLCQYLP